MTSPAATSAKACSSSCSRSPPRARLRRGGSARCAVATLGARSTSPEACPSCVRVLVLCGWCCVWRAVPVVTTTKSRGGVTRNTPGNNSRGAVAGQQRSCGCRALLSFFFFFSSFFRSHLRLVVMCGHEKQVAGVAAQWCARLLLFLLFFGAGIFAGT